MIDKYLVMPWEWLEDSLTGSELEKMYEFLERASFDKEEDRYYVVNTKVPYSNEVLKIIKNGGYKKPEKISKGQLLDKLRELSKLQDGEIAHIEAVEALLDYINDDEIIDAYSDIPLYFEGNNE